MIRNLITLSVFFFTSGLAVGAAERPPNIVLIFVDDLGYGDIGPFGGTKVPTPHLDQLAKQGRKFTSFYATPVCSMSRACLMTGCYNTRVSIPGVLFPNSDIGLHPDEWTIADVAKQKGYRTKCIGKWHLGHHEAFLPTKQGFDSYLGIPYSNDMTLDIRNPKFAADCVFRESMDRTKAVAQAIKHTVPLMRDEEIIEYPVDQSTLTKRYTEAAVEFIRAQKDQPFLLYLPHTMVHIPLAASEVFRNRHPNDLLAAAIEEVDWSVGEIMKTLDELKLEQDTLVIFTSDNGAAVGSSLPWRGKKASQFEGGVREPCIMRWPGKIPSNTTCDAIAGNIDVLPTIAKLLGVSLPTERKLDGVDIQGLMFDQDNSVGRDTHLYFAANQQLAGIRVKEWKLLLTMPTPNKKQAANQKQPEDGQGPWLFNLQLDPKESRNVAQEHPEIVEQMKAEAARREEAIKREQRPAGKV